MGPRSWLTGQAVALREITWALIKSPPDQRSQLLDQENALVWLLDKTGFGNDLSKFSAFPGIQQSANEIAERAAKWNPTSDSMMSILQTLAACDSEFQATNGSKENLFYRALRVTLALERLAVALNLSPKIEKELNALRSDVQRHYDFDVAAFAGHLRALRTKL
jgi:hypothetical protein